MTIESDTDAIHMARCTASFDVTGWEQAPYAEPDHGPTLARATVRKTFRGGLQGESVAELLMCQADPKDLGAGAGYVASERFVGTLDGKSGTFVLQHGGLTGAGAPQTFGNIVPGSGTGELAGLLGTAKISVGTDGKHSLALEYELP